MRLIWAILILILSAGSAFCGTVGKVTGVVSDKATGNPLAGANVVLKGTSTTRGFSVDARGRFSFLNVPPGVYRIKCSYVGYQTLVVKKVKVETDLTTRLDLTLARRAIEVEAVLEVLADRPLVQLDRTSTIRQIELDDLERLPVRGYSDLAALQAGVTNHDGYLYVRGGRLEEVDTIIDGVSHRDLQSGMATTAVNMRAIERVELLAGGFDAEYGRVMSGIVRVVTREGGDACSGALEYTTDRITGDSWLKTPSFGYNNVDFALGGPFRPGDDGATFFVSGEWRDREDGQPRWGVSAQPFERDTLPEEAFNALSAGRLPHNGLGGWTLQSKLAFRFGDNATLKLGALGSVNDRDLYQHNYRYDLKHAPVIKDDNLSVFGSMTWTIGNRAFFTLGAHGFKTRHRAGDGVHFDKLYDYARPNGNSGTDPEVLFWQGPNAETGDEGHLYNEYLQRESFYITPIDFDLTSQITPHHQLKAGLDLQRHRVRFYHHLMPTQTYLGPYRGPDDPGGFARVNRYGYTFRSEGQEIVPLLTGLDAEKNPILASVYVQDKMEYEGLVVNLGLRYDYMAPRTERLTNETMPTGGDSSLGPEDLAGQKAYHRFSPRIGFGFPVSDRTVCHANFGVFSQMPNLEDLYVGYEFLEYWMPRGELYAFPNPNLKPEETTAYEVGVTRQLGEHGRLTATAYRKSISHLIQVASVVSKPAKYTYYRNQDFGTVKGVELEASQRRTKRLALQFSYTLQYADGTGSNADSHGRIAWGFVQGVTEPPKITAPLDFDQRHKVSAIVDYRFGRDDGPTWDGAYPLSEAGINVLLSAGSGFPYTPATPSNVVSLGSAVYSPVGPTNSGRGPWSYQLDLKANKTTHFGEVEVDWYVWVVNVLNRRNISALDRTGTGIQTAVYSATGSPVTSRWLRTAEGREFVQRFGDSGREKFLLKELDPMNFSTPRQVRFGVSLGF